MQMPIFNLFVSNPKPGEFYSQYNAKNPIRVRAANESRAREGLQLFMANLMENPSVDRPPWLKKEETQCIMTEGSMTEAVEDEEEEILAPPDMRKKWLASLHQNDMSCDERRERKDAEKAQKPLSEPL